MKPTMKQFNDFWNSFIESRSQKHNQKTYNSAYDTAARVMENMEEFFFAEERAKEARRATYEELKKEFESEILQTPQVL